MKAGIGLVLLMNVSLSLILTGAIAAEAIDPVQLAQRYTEAYAKVVKEAEARGLVVDVKKDPILVAVGQELELTLRGQPETVLRTFKEELDKRLEPLQQAYGKYVEQKWAEDDQRNKERLNKLRQQQYEGRTRK